MSSLAILTLVVKTLLATEPPVIVRMHRVHVQSEAIMAIGYHHKTRTLEIDFRSHEIYRYAQVPAAVYQEFLAAESKGHYFQDHIRGRYEYWRVEKN